MTSERENVRGKKANVFTRPVTQTLCTYNAH